MHKKDNMGEQNYQNKYLKNAIVILAKSEHKQTMLQKNCNVR